MHDSKESKIPYRFDILDNGELARALQACFMRSYNFIMLQREMRSEGDRTIIKLPEDIREYLAIYTTEYEDSYIFEAIAAEDIILLKQAVENQSERVLESNFNFDITDKDFRNS